MMNVSKSRKSNPTIFLIIIDMIPEASLTYKMCKGGGHWEGNPNINKITHFCFYILSYWVILQLTGYLSLIYKLVGLDQ